MKLPNFLLRTLLPLIALGWTATGLPAADEEYKCPPDLLSVLPNPPIDEKWLAELEKIAADLNTASKDPKALDTEWARFSDEYDRIDEIFRKEDAYLPDDGRLNDFIRAHHPLLASVLKRNGMTPYQYYVRLDLVETFDAFATEGFKPYTDREFQTNYQFYVKHQDRFRKAYRPRPLRHAPH